jgi:pimeloyl-ACP methyl ester carboxylesterase
VTRKKISMATFVLVHGAWHGGWCWDKLAPLLRTAGHIVHTPTLAGLAERAHLLTRNIGLETHIQEIISLLDDSDLHGVILVGHSYGGMVITGVAEQAPALIGHLVYLDAVAPIGEERSLQELFQRHRPDNWRELAAEIARGEGWFIPVPTGDTLMGITDSTDLRWVRSHLTPHPAKTFLQRLEGDHHPHGLAVSFIRTPTRSGTPNGFSADAERVQQAGGKYYELPGGHDAMVTMPRELAAILAEIAYAH